MKNTWQTWSARIDQWPVYRRVILGLGLLTLIVVLFQGQFLDDLERRGTLSRGTIAVLETELAKLKAESEVVVARSRADPNVPLQQQLQLLRHREVDLDQRLASLTESLIPPAQMAKAIETVLTRDTPLVLVHLEGLGSESVLAPGADDAPADVLQAIQNKGISVPSLYRHGLRMVFEGSYLETLDYLRALEKLPLNILWNQVEIHVETHPKAKVTLEVYTLSLYKEWIGV
jgi:MSHA biogenesis protein MshJ